MRTKEQNLALKRLIEAAFDYADFVGRKEIREVLEARKDAETRTALLAGLERKLTQGDKALVGNAGYRRFLADPAGEALPSMRRRSRLTLVMMVCLCYAPIPS